MKWIYLLFLSILLSGCSTSLFTDLAASPGAILYQDDFSNPASGWPRLSDAAGKMDYRTAGDYEIVVNTPNFDVWSTSGYVYKNVRIEVEAIQLAGSVESRFGLVCRYRNSENYYFFVITSDGYEAIGKVSQGTRTLIDQDLMVYNPAIPTGNGPFHLRFDCSGSTLTGSVNGQVVAQVQADEFSSGDAGMIAGTFDQPGTDVAFDNFVVYKP